MIVSVLMWIEINYGVISSEAPQARSRETCIGFLRRRTQMQVPPLHIADAMLRSE